MPITDPTWNFFVVLGIILFAPMLLERLRVPSIVGLIFAGVLIGPHGFGVLERDDSFELFGKVGLYYIMFLASLEMNLQDVQKIKGRALTLGLLSFAIPMAIGFGVNRAVLPGYAVAAAVLMAAMYASHTLISYPIVLRYGISRLPSVSIAVGGTIVADTLTLLVLAVVGGMFKEQVTGLYWLWLVAKVMLIGAAILLAFPAAGRWFFRRYDDGVVQYIFVLVLVFLGAGLMEMVGIEGILGAFLAGLALNRLIPPTSPLMSHVEFVGNALFIPYFLIGVGMLINVRLAFSDTGVLWVALAITLFGTAGKPGESGFSHHVDDFMRVANNGRQAARQGSGFKSDRRHHAGFNMQVSINKPWHRRCAASINPLQSRSISVFCANTGNVTSFNHNWAGNFSAIDQVENRDIINNIIGNSVATGNG